jgi:hypothetical protein
VAGVIFPGVAQRFGRGLNRICFRMHRFDLAAQATPRQLKKSECGPGETVWKQSHPTRGPSAGFPWSALL